jgi:hypothetical protein
VVLRWFRALPRRLPNPRAEDRRLGTGAALPPSGIPEISSPGGAGRFLGAVFLAAGLAFSLGASLALSLGAPFFGAPLTVSSGLFCGPFPFCEHFFGPFSPSLAGPRGGFLAGPALGLLAPDFGDPGAGRGEAGGGGGALGDVGDVGGEAGAPGAVFLYKQEGIVSRSGVMTVSPCSSGYGARVTV